MLASAYQTSVFPSQWGWDEKCAFASTCECGSDFQSHPNSPTSQPSGAGPQAYRQSLKTFEKPKTKEEAEEMTTQTHIQ